MVPAFVGLVSLDNLICYILGYAVFTVATITDYYDGKIARERNLETNFGRLLDPVADKVLMVSAFIVLMLIPELEIPGWTLMFIVGREFLITGARSLAASEGAVIGANVWGKTKVIVQMVYVYVFLFFVIVARLLGIWAPSALPTYAKILGEASFYAMVAVAALTVYSGVQFARINWKVLNLGDLK